MASQILKYKAGNIELASQLFMPDGPSLYPAVLIFPGGSGLGEHYFDLARKLTSLGYAALACDLYGNGQTMDKDLSKVMPIINRLTSDPALIRIRARASLDAVRAVPQVNAERVAAVGYCLGGVFALELARSGGDIRAAIGIHTPVITASPADAANIKAKILVINGAEDHLVSEAQRAGFEKEMGDAKADWQMHVYGGVTHSFSIPDAAAFGRPDLNRYDRVAAARAWRSTTDLLEDIFADRED
ncbi:dienelactone hydrolase family protein [Rhizorhabdus dicambivorans]|nr:dienelactone hydrolase family protein [Rhizorhabdus dicambivorans]